MKKLNVTVDFSVHVHTGDYFYGSDASTINNRFTVPMAVWNAIDYSEIIKEMVKDAYNEHENLMTEEDGEDKWTKERD